MSNKVKSIIFYAATVAVAIFLIWFSFKDFSPKDPLTNEPISKADYFLIKLKEANLFYIFLSAFFALLSHMVRAERWKLLMEPLGQKITLKHSFIAVMIGYFINLVIPRGGEVSRSVTLSRMNRNVKIDSCLGTIVAERVIDLVFLISCIGIAFLIEFDSLSAFIKAQSSTTTTTEGESFTKWIILGSIGLFFIILYLLMKKLSLFENLRKKAVEFLFGLRQGFMTVLKLKRAKLFIFYSFSIWVLYYFMCYAVFLAFPATENLGPMAALSIFAIGGIAMAIPIPGGTGTYHAFVPAGIIFLYGTGSRYVKEMFANNPNFTQADVITDNEATAFATIFHGWQTIVVIIVGAICMAVGNKIIKKEKQAEHLSKNTTPTNSL